MDLSKYASGAGASPPAEPASPSVGYPSNGNPGTGTPATVPGDFWFWQMQAEIGALLAYAGITPDSGSLAQVRDAVYAMINAPFIGTNFLADENGYQKLPSGIIVQWCSGTTDVNGVAQPTLPLAFPTQTLKAFCQVYTATPQAYITNISEVTTTLVRGHVVDTSGLPISGASVYFFAIGH